MCAGDLGAGRFRRIVGRFGRERLVEREADGLNRNIGCAGAFEKRAVFRDCLAGCRDWWTRGGLWVPENARRHVATAADGDHELGVEFIEDALGGILTLLVDLGQR